MDCARLGNLSWQLTSCVIFLYQQNKVLGAVWPETRGPRDRSAEQTKQLHTLARTPVQKPTEAKPKLKSAKSEAKLETSHQVKFCNMEYFPEVGTKNRKWCFRAGKGKGRRQTASYVTSCRL
jgi:hypothetical protein